LLNAAFAMAILDLISHVHLPGKIIVLYILIFIFLDIRLEDKRSCTEW